MRIDVGLRCRVSGKGSGGRGNRIAFQVQADSFPAVFGSWHHSHVAAAGHQWLSASPCHTTLERYLQPSSAS